MNTLCPNCEQGTLVSAVDVEEFPHHGVTLSIDEYEFSECPVCHSQIVLMDQAKRNEVRFADARRIHDGLLTSAEIKELRSRHQLTQSKAADLFGGGPNAFSKYERGEACQSKQMDMLLRLFDRSVQCRSLIKANFDDSSLLLHVDWIRPAHSAQCVYAAPTQRTTAVRVMERTRSSYLRARKPKTLQKASWEKHA